MGKKGRKHVHLLHVNMLTAKRERENNEVEKCLRDHCRHSILNTTFIKVLKYVCLISLMLMRHFLFDNVINIYLICLKGYPA
jgi:hypothetical protein